MLHIWYILFVGNIAFRINMLKMCCSNIRIAYEKGCISASFPQIYSNNKKGRESDKSDSKKIMKNINKMYSNFCLCLYHNLKS